MKAVLIGLVLGLSAAGALGATTIKMVDRATGSSRLDVTAPGVAGSVRTIDIVITTDEANAEDPTSGSGFGGLVSWDIHGGFLPPGTGFLLTAQITTANYIVGDDFNWDSTQGLTTAKGTYPMNWPTTGLNLGTICYIDTSVEPASVWPAFSGTAMSFQITLPADPVPLGVFSGHGCAHVYPAGSSEMTWVPLSLEDPGPDSDGDGLADAWDNCPTVPNADQANADGDATGDVCDPCTDTDHDGFGNPGFPANTCPTDNCPTKSNADQLDTDVDGTGNVCDNCATIYNPQQEDTDHDGKGNACDNCPLVSNPTQTDTDGDTQGDVCDNCPAQPNSDQLDTDGDRKGDVCDNCPYVSNSNQADGDSDGIGDACDPPIVAWRSVRFHTIGGGLGFDLPIMLDPTASSGGAAGPTVETRQGGIRRIEIDFDRVITLTPALVIVAENMATGVTHLATSTTRAGGNRMLVIEFADGLPNKACYRIDLAGQIVDLAGDSDCLIRATVGDVDGNGYTNLTDVAQVKMRNAAPTGEDQNAKYDVNLDCAINLTDVATVKMLNSADRVLCP